MITVDKDIGNCECRKEKKKTMRMWLPNRDLVGYPIRCYELRHYRSGS